MLLGVICDIHQKWKVCTFFFLCNIFAAIVVKLNIINAICFISLAIVPWQLLLNSVCSGKESQGKTWQGRKALAPR